MAIWKEQSPPKKEALPLSPEFPPRKEADMSSDFSSNYDAARRIPERDMKESVIAAELTIEGKIEGSGHVRIAGRFKGDVHVQGNLTIELGAKLTGSVRAGTVIIAGELEGNIEDAVRVELVESGVLSGNVKAGSLTVAAGSRMRGQADFGWDEKTPTNNRKGAMKEEVVAAL
jgi:cytoskeletal protein CcmA (bactofilin family)